jgi:c-di-GMP phosphodiesterase
MATAMLSDDLELDELEQIVRSDPALAMHLMQAASVGRLGETRRRIDSLRHALVLMGTRRARNWAALLLARSATQSERADRFVGTLIRARACELLALQKDQSFGHLAFAAGMLSSLQVQLDMSAEALCDGSALSDELAGAAFHGTGPVGEIVWDVVDHEVGRVVEGRRTGSDDDTMHMVFADAIAWSVERCGALEPATEHRVALSG